MVDEQQLFLCLKASIRALILGDGLRRLWIVCSAERASDDNKKQNYRLNYLEYSNYYYQLPP